MNNMHFDETTQTYRGTIEPYRWNVEEQGQVFTGFNKPLQVTPEWIAQSYFDVFASYWQDQWNNQGGGEIFTVKPWACMEQTQNLLTKASDGALQQLIQAMAGFAPAPVASTGGLMVGSYSPVQMLAMDGGA